VEEEIPLGIAPSARIRRVSSDSVATWDTTWSRLEDSTCGRYNDEGRTADEIRGYNGSRFNIAPSHTKSTEHCNRRTGNRKAILKIVDGYGGWCYHQGVMLRRKALI
jgi:hypothetical protein